MSEKSTDDEIQERLDVVVGFLIEGRSQAEIVRFLFKEMETEWGVTKRQLRNYCAMAREKLRGIVNHEIDLDAELAKADARLNRQYFKADLQQDVSKAIQAEAKRIELWGLREYAARKQAAGELSPEASQLFEEIIEAARHGSDEN